MAAVETQGQDGESGDRPIWFPTRLMHAENLERPAWISEGPQPIQS